MHELGIIIQVVNHVEQFAKDNNLTEIDKIVLEVGELSSMYPKYIEDVYPIAVELTSLKNTKLEIEMLPGLGSCKHCNFGYNLKLNNNKCPLCGSEEYLVISGTEFNIKSIHAK
jgi:hydrogenase nickel incorporation protein HypA/HybF